jgi:methionyl aminopeptidase
MVPLKTQKEIELIRESSRIVADVLKLVGATARPGMTTLELDKLAEDYIRANGAEPAFKGYGWDILSIDVGAKKDGYYGDGAWSFAIGEIDSERQRLLRVTEESLMKGIEQAVAGNRLHDISAAVQSFVEANGFSVVRDLVGHGIGKKLHEEPSVPNYGEAGTGLLLKEGMTLAIEPMVNSGTWRVSVAADGWTVSTADGRPSAHFEHTVAVRNGKAEILTQL